MTISIETDRAFYAGGPASVPVPFKIWSDSDVIVTLDDGAGTAEALTLDVDYTVNGIGTASVTVDFNISTTGYTIGIISAISALQETSFYDGDKFPASVFETTFDRLVRLVQQAIGTLKRCIKIPESVDPDVYDLDISGGFANKVLKFDAAGNVMPYLLDPPHPYTAQPSDYEPHDYFVDATVTDQGAATTEGNRSLKDLVDVISTSQKARIVLTHSGAGASTTYTLTTNLTIPSNIELVGRHGAVIDGTGTLTLNGPLEAGLYQIFGSNLTLAGSPKIEAVYPEWFGAKGDGVTDDTISLSNSISFAKLNWSKLHIKNGTYVISSALPTLNSGFNTISVIGESKRNTKIDCSNIVSTLSAISLYGGSGQLSSGYLSDLTIVGSGIESGFENKGLGGFKLYRVGFDNLKYGIIFSNDCSGAFTEYSVAHECGFSSSVETPVFYKKGVGTESFHGSGLLQCQLHRNFSASPSIKIGDSSDTGSLYLYNAPLDFQIWSAVEGNIIEISSSISSLVCTYGTITLEISGTLQPILASGGSILHAGNLLSFNKIKLGSLSLVERAWINSDSTMSAVYKSSTIQEDNSATDTITLINMATQGTIFFVNFVGGNYDYKYLIVGQRSSYGGGGGGSRVTVLAAINTFNDSGWGGPTFSIDDNTGLVTATNSHWVGSTVTAKITELGGNTRSYGFGNQVQ